MDLFIKPAHHEDTTCMQNKNLKNCYCAKIVDVGQALTHRGRVVQFNRGITGLGAQDGQAYLP